MRFCPVTMISRNGCGDSASPGASTYVNSRKEKAPPVRAGLPGVPTAGDTVAGQLYVTGSPLFLGDTAARIDLKAYLLAVLRRGAGVHLGSGRAANTTRLRLLAGCGRAANTTRLRLLAGSGRAAHLLAA